MPAVLDRAPAVVPYSPFPRQRAFHECRAGEALFGGAAGPGKAGHVDAKVITPFGEQRLGDLRVGSQVSNPDGSVARVLGVYPQGEQDLYRLTFADGASTLATRDHLWLAWQGSKRYKAARRYVDGDPVRGRLYTTAGMMDGLRRRGPRRYAPIVPLCAPVRFTKSYRVDMRPLDPYLLGLLIGDGSFTGSGSISYSSADPALLDEVRQRTQGLAEWVLHPPYQFRSKNAGALRAALERLGLFGHRAEGKWVPEPYRLAEYEVRLSVLQGLLDTDGSADARDGQVEFCSVSERLARDVQWLVRSIGGKARLSHRRGGYVKDGRRVECLEAYRVAIQTRHDADLFRLERKRARCRTAFNGGASDLGRRLVSVEPEGRGEAQCIAVDHPNGLYLTDDFIVTHNTSALMWELFHQAAETPGLDFIIFRRTYPQLQKSLIQRSLTAFPRRVCEYNAQEHCWRFVNEARLWFGHAQHSTSIYGYQGSEFAGIGIDELTEWEEPMYRFGLRLLRTTTASAWPRMRGTTNPTGLGHEWCKARFVQPVLDGHVEPDAVWTPAPSDDDPEPMSRAYLPATYTDNPALLLADPGYIGRLKQLPARERLALLTGSWELPLADGGVFDPELVTAIHDGATGLSPAVWRCGRCRLDWMEPRWSRLTQTREEEVVLMGAREWAPEVVYTSRPTCPACQGPLAARQYLTAWDVARKRDWAVGITADVSVSPAQVVAFERFQKVPWPVLAERVHRRWALYPGRTLVDSTGVGDAFLGFVKVPVEGILFSGKSKADMLQALVLLLERGGLKAPTTGQGIERLRTELLLYQWEDADLVQDCVMAAAMLASALPRYGDSGITV